MVAFARLLLSSLLLIALAGASPIQSDTAVLGDNFKLPSFNPEKLLCTLHLLPRALCPRQSSSGNSVSTPIGTAQGTSPNNGAVRFAVKYASAQRWQNPVVATAWDLPNGSSDPTALPLACAQTDLDPSQFSEDCLSMLLYVPTTLTSSSKVPVFLWIHGGSFIHGSATGPGLDGTNLAKATDSIVAVVQYRLGALGFNSPDGRTNFAVQDIAASLQFLNKVIASFGGDASKITVAGQSSGANMIRALLAAPSISSLFQSAILHSDPMDYGFLASSVQSELQDFFNQQINCSATDNACINALSLGTVLYASDALYNNGFNVDPSATQEQPMRPVRDGSLITTSLDSTTPFPHVSKPIIVSTVLNEAGPAIYGQFDSPMTASFFQEVVDGTFEEPRASNLLDSPDYQVPTLADGQEADARVQLQQMGTDQIFRCATWTFARNWAQNGGTAFVSQYTVGATYPDNQGLDYCTEPGVVCHEDDIMIFGTVTNPSSAQSSLISEVQARYKAFLLTGNPNPSGSGLSNWSPATNGNFLAHQLGSSGSTVVGACTTNFWGTSAVPYDYQVFDI
ncbi:alpha beta-hydrolase [Gloeopeniophorella convolvens]|nr:alpha beta-hydrolase [Gloeopeniophorella convolvens]